MKTLLNLDCLRATLLVLGLLASLEAGAAGAVEFFVSPGGNDSASGTRAEPFATLEGARNAIRRLKAVSPLPSGGITVWIRAGTYLRDATFELMPEDSGTESCPITYRGVDSEQVRLLGGRSIPKLIPVTDEQTLSRLDPAARGHVLQADLRALGIASLGELQSRGFGRPTVAAHAELFFNGQPMTLARWPNEGAWERIAGFPETSAKGDDHGGNIGQLADGFFYAGDRPRRWQRSTNIWVHGYWAWDWANSYERVDSLDLEKHLIQTAPPYGLYGFRKGQRFYFLNVLEELDTPGEWFLDRATERLYFWPPGPTQAQGSADARPPSQRAEEHAGQVPEVLLSLLGTPLISMQGVSHVAFRGLELEATRAHAIVIHGGTNDVISNCALRLIGNYGVWIEGGHGHSVVECDIEQTGDGGVNLNGGDRRTLEPGGHSVENCRFRQQGRWSKCYVPAVLISGVGQRVAHNLIQDHPHCAILFSGNEHHIEFNEIHHVALETGDVGAIYAGRDWTFRGNVIRYNYIHDTGGVGMGSMGVYMDDCVSGTEIFGNIFYKVSRAAFLGGGRDHHVENNVFVGCNPAVQLDGRGLDLSPVWHDMVYNYMKQNLEQMPIELYRRRYPDLAKIEGYYRSTTNGIPPEGNIVAHNICAGGKWLSVGWHAREQMMDLHDNYVVANADLAGFVAPEKLDFRLRPDSPAWQAGFKAIPIEQIGPLHKGQSPN
jgi:hypothetical protein